MEFKFRAKLWLYDTTGASWHFVTVPPDISADIQELTGPRKGFGSVRVEVQLTDTLWRTSLFPDAKTGRYFLPVKKTVRDAANLTVGHSADYSIRLI